MLNKDILFKMKMALFFMAVIALFSCEQYESKRNFYLSPVASFPGTVTELKNRWFFCEKCLSGEGCKPDDIEQCKAITIPDRDDALNYAIGRANTEAVYFLVDVAKTNVNGVAGKSKETPLMIAAYYGTIKHQKIADFLIHQGADINETSSSPMDSALITAIWKNNVDFAIFLLKNGADPSVTAVGKKEGYACRYAMRKKLAELIPYIPGCCSLVGKDSRWIRDVGYFCP